MKKFFAGCLMFNMMGVSANSLVEACSKTENVKYEQCSSRQSKNEKKEGGVFSSCLKAAGKTLIYVSDKAVDIGKVAIGVFLGNDLFKNEENSIAAKAYLATEDFVYNKVDQVSNFIKNTIAKYAGDKGIFEATRDYFYNGLKWCKENVTNSYEELTSAAVACYSPDYDTEPVACCCSFDGDAGMLPPSQPESSSLANVRLSKKNNAEVKASNSVVDDTEAFYENVYAMMDDDVLARPYESKFGDMKGELGVSRNSYFRRNGWRSFKTK